RIAHLNVGALLLRFFGEFGAGHGGAVDAVAAGAGAHVDHRVTDARGLSVEDIFLLAYAEGENVHQRVAIVAGLENAFSADGRHPEAVAVVRDAADHTGEDASVACAGLRIIKAAEAEGVHHCDRPRTHGKDVAEDTAHTRGRALERLDEAGVIVRLD